MTTKAEKKTTRRRRRTADEMIADLEAEIDRVKARAAAKEAKADPAGKALLSATKAIDKALDVAQQRKSTEIVRALEAARRPLSETLAGMGVRPPGTTKKRGRKPAAG